MSSPYESANLILRLYELRREPTMREARNWYVRSFHPSTSEEVVQTLGGPNSAHFRMVTSYWDMACSFVTNGAIDEKMFLDANGEQNIVYCKIEPFIDAYRAAISRTAMVHLEAVVMKAPDAKARMAALRDRFRSMPPAR
jgi:hypothetical protein